MKLLLEHKADVNMTENNGWTALMTGCQQPLSDNSDMLLCVQYCHAAGADLNFRTLVDDEDPLSGYAKKGSSALDIAKSSGRADTSSYLNSVSNF